MIVFVLRHADRQSDQVDDLNAAGRERAQVLARALSDSGVSKAYYSGAVRARRTLDPLVRALGNSLEIVRIEDPSATVDAVKALPQETVAAVIGHSNTVGPIIKGLSGVHVEELAGHEFDKLFVVFTDPVSESVLLRMRYGSAT